MLCFVAFHLGLHCLLKMFMGLQYKEVNERLFLNYRKVNGVSWLINAVIRESKPSIDSVINVARRMGAGVTDWHKL